MSWVRLASIPLNTDLSSLLRLLQQRAIVHRVTEEQGAQWLWLARAEDVEQVTELVERWLAGDKSLSQPASAEAPGRPQSSGSAGLWPQLRRLPLTLLLLLMSLLGAGLIEWDAQLGLAHWLSWQDYVLRDGYVGFYHWRAAMEQWQWWRLWTPMFLHFGIFHLLFNSLWLWELGRRFEWLYGWRGYLGFLLVVALAANLSQYLWQGPSLFGGMSGVIYGLVGYLWIHQRLLPQPVFAVPPGLIIFMLLWLVLCMSGAVNMFIDGEVANAAHLGGLLAGMLLAYLRVVIVRRGSKNSRV